MRKTGEKTHPHPQSAKNIRTQAIGDLFNLCFSQRLNQTYRQLLNDNELLTADHKEIKSQLNEAKLEHTWLQADFSKLKKEFQELDITSTKLNNQCEVQACSTLCLLSLHVRIYSFLRHFNAV